ncbi:MAG: GNAT family N-acetyltransferase [Anaerolineae bacterium]|nr:GNAT family N-acetyltransferase [Anaerolineae bacterium]
MTIEQLADTLHQTPTELIQLADRHIRTVQMWLCSRAPDAIRWEGLGVDVASTGLPVPILNLALGKRYPPETPEATIGDEIERVKAIFAERNVPWYWWLGPNPQPSTMSQLFLSHNLWFEPPALPAVLVPLPARPVDYNPRIQTWRAANMVDLETASTIRRLAYRFPEGVGSHYYEDMADDWLSSDSVRLYLGGLEADTPAVIGTSIQVDGVIGLYALATLPTWRRRGLGKALLARMMADAAAEGHRFAVMTASPYGYPVLKQFGVEHLFDYELYSLP